MSPLSTGVPETSVEPYTFTQCQGQAALLKISSTCGGLYHPQEKKRGGDLFNPPLKIHYLQALNSFFTFESSCGPNDEHMVFDGPLE